MIVGIVIETETAPIGLVGSAKLNVNVQLSEHKQQNARASGSGNDPNAGAMCTVRPIMAIAAGIMAAGIMAAGTEALATARSREAIVTDWIEARRMLATAGPSIQITRATIDPEIQRTATGSGEGTKSDIASIMAADDSSSTIVRT